MFLIHRMYFFELISVYCQIFKMTCQVKKNEHLQHLIFAFNQCSKAAKAADLYSADFY